MNKFLLRFDEERNDIIWGRDYDQSLTEPGPEIPPSAIFIQEDSALGDLFDQLVGNADDNITGIVSDNTAPSSDKVTVNLADPESPTNILAYVENNVIHIYTSSDKIICPPVLNSIFNMWSSLVDISGLSNWDTSNTTSLHGLFNGTAISDLAPISNWDVSKVSSIGYLFQGTNISNTDPIANWKIGGDMFEFKGVDINRTFALCDNLTSLNIGGWDLTYALNVSDTFSNTPINTITCTAATRSVIEPYVPEGTMFFLPEAGGV